jgi:hypothetical protein
VVSIDTQISDGMRNRIQELLVADGVEDWRALSEANSLVDGLGYYDRVATSTGLKIRKGYDGLEVIGPHGDLLERIPFTRAKTEEFY